MKFYYNIAFSCAIALLTIAIIGCSEMPEENVYPSSTGANGMMVLHLGNSNSMSNTLLPAIDMDIASYDIKGTGPNGEIFNITSDQSIVEVPDLALGDWTVHINGKNADNDIIGQGSASTVVNVGTTSYVSIPVSPLTGAGTLNVSIAWTGADTFNPAVAATLIPAQGAEIPLTFTITDGNTATYSNDAIPAGYYTITLKLMDGEVLTAGTTEVVRIVEAQTTTGSFTYNDINKAPGNIEVNIDPQMNEPIDVTLTGQEAEIKEGQTMTINASVPADIGNVTCIWYINGESKSIGTSYTLGSDLPQGNYTVSATCYNVDGSRAGSTSHSFKVTEPPTYVKSLVRMFYGNGDRNGYMKYVYDNNGNLFRTIAYNGPGDDGQWETEDDEISPFTGMYGSSVKYEYDSENNLIQEISYMGPGSDNVWLTEDDEIFCYKKESKISSTLSRTTIYNKGDDNIWFTIDDTVTSYSEEEITDNGTVEHKKLFSASGDDTVWFTVDDIVSSYVKIVNDGTGKKMHVYSSAGIGTDNQWFTNDDNFVMVTSNTYDMTNKIVTHISASDSGTDNTWFTGDDVIGGSNKKYYNDDFTQMLKGAMFNDMGADNIWGTEDDIVNSYYQYTYDNYGNETFSKSYSGSGSDGLWFTEDDIIMMQSETVYIEQ